MDLLLLLVVVLLVGVLVMFARSYQRLSVEVERLKRDDHRQHSRAYHRASKIVDEARQRSQELVEASEEKAAEIINESQELNDETKARIAAAVEESSRHQIQTYEATLGNIEKSITQILHNVPEDIKKQSAQELQKMLTSISHDLETSSREVKAQLQEQVKQRLFDAARDAVLQTVGKTLTKEEHEQLIIKAFEEHV